MAGNNIYVQGSYIDVHDNENVYLSVDKAEVSVRDATAPVGDTDGQDESAAVPEELASEQAMVYWQRLQEHGFVDANYRLLPGTTRQQAMYIAEPFAEKLGLSTKWKLFEKWWRVRHLAQEKTKFLDTGKSPSRAEVIDGIFRD